MTTYTAKPNQIEISHKLKANIAPITSCQNLFIYLIISIIKVKSQYEKSAL